MLISCPTLIITIKLIVLFSFEKERERERTKHELFKKNSKYLKFCIFFLKMLETIYR